MDTDETVRILRTLGDNEGAPARVDLAAAVVVGRKRRHRRRLTSGLASAAAVALVIAAIPVIRASLQEPPPTRHQPTFVGPTSLTCTEHVLPGGNSYASVGAADPTGRYLAAGDTHLEGGRFAVWDNGVLTVLSVPQPGSPQPPWEMSPVRPIDIAPDGTVLLLAGKSQHPLTYSHGRFTELAPLTAAGDTEATTMGDQGTVGGVYYGPPQKGLFPASLGQPIVWRTAASPPVQLPLPGPSWSGRVIDIDSDGTTLGNAQQPTVRPLNPPGQPTTDWLGSASVPPPDVNRAVVWRPGHTYKLLPMPPGIPAAYSLTAISIHDGIIVVEASGTTPGGWVEIPFLYDLKTGRYIRLPGAEVNHTGREQIPSMVRGGNAQGWLLFDDQQGSPYLYTPNTGRVPLPAFKKKPSILVIAPYANTISEKGRIIGGTDVIDGRGGIPVYWTCR